MPESKQQKLERLTRETEDLKRETADAREQVEAVQKQAAELEERKAAALAKNSELKAKNSGLRRELDSLQAEAAMRDRRKEIEERVAFYQLKPTQPLISTLLATSTQEGREKILAMVFGCVRAATATSGVVSQPRFRGKPRISFDSYDVWKGSQNGNGDNGH